MGRKEIKYKTDIPLTEMLEIISDDSKKTTEKAIEKFSKLTQEEMKEEAEQSKNNMFLQEGSNRLVSFNKKEIRSVFHDNSWCFSVIDVISAVTEKEGNMRRYWSDLKSKLKKEGYEQLYDKIVQLKIVAEDGKMRFTDCVETETLFRLIQSIPSKKAEPFRKWLAKVGYERILETQDPSIAIKRAIATYKAKGYDDEWIKSRVQSITARKELTNEWKKRGVKDLEYGILTDAISVETFDVQIKQHKEIKSLKKYHNLRDNMSPLELALTMLGETTTVELAKAYNSQGFIENKESAIMGEKIAGGTRKNIEKKLGKSVISKDNYLNKNKINQKEIDSI